MGIKALPLEHLESAPSHGRDYDRAPVLKMWAALSFGKVQK